MDVRFEAGRLSSILFYMLIAVLTCLMACQIGRQGKKVCVSARQTRSELWDRIFLWGIFAVLFAVLAFRFHIGNDYEQYTRTAHEAYVGGYVVTEVGFNLTVKGIYQLFGGEVYEAVFALFGFFSLLFFFRAFMQQSVNFGQTFFLFMTFGLYFQTFNTMRYYLVLAIALYAMKYVLTGDLIKFVFWILVASLFHKSVLLVIPVYWAASRVWKKWHLVAGGIVCVGCYLGRSLILKLALVLYPSYRNTVYLEGNEYSLFSILRITAVLALYVWFAAYSKENLKNTEHYDKLRFYGQLNLLAFAAGTFFSFLPVITRIMYYFSISQLFLIPLILNQITDLRVKKRVKLVVYTACIGYFLLFLLQAHRDGVGLLPYRSWLFETERFIYK